MGFSRGQSSRLHLWLKISACQRTEAFGFTVSGEFGARQSFVQPCWEQCSELSRGCNGCCLLASLETELKEERKSSYSFWSGEWRSTGW